MPKKSDLLKQQRSAKLDAQQALNNKAKAENREFTAEEETTFDATQGEIEALDAQIERALKVERNEIEIASRSANPVNGDRGDGEGDGEGAEKRKMAKAYSITRHISLAGKEKPIDGVEKEMQDLAIAESRAAGVKVDDHANVHIPMSVLRGTGQSVSEDAGAYGGILVHDQAPRVQPTFMPRLFLEELGATRLSNLQGGDLPLPSAGAAVFQWLAETEEIQDQKVPIGGPVCY